MPYNERIEEKISDITKRWKNMGSKNMFGGVCYLYNGNMCFGIWKDFLIVRCGEETAEKKLKLKSTQPFDITGKPMRGWLMVDESGWKRKESLKKWLDLGKTFAQSLPPK